MRGRFFHASSASSRLNQLAHAEKILDHLMGMCVIWREMAIAIFIYCCSYVPIKIFMIETEPSIKHWWCDFNMILYSVSTAAIAKSLIFCMLVGCQENSS